MLTLQTPGAESVRLEAPAVVDCIKIGFALAIGFWLASALVWALYLYALASLFRPYLLGLS